MNHVIVVQKGLHPENHTLINEMHKTLHTDRGWFLLGITSLAKENDDLDMTVQTSHGLIDQGVFFLFDAFKHVQKNADLSVNFKSYTNNGEKNTVVDDIVFTYKDDPTVNIVLECERVADAIFQTLKTVITVYRDGNKRIVTLINKRRKLLT